MGDAGCELRVARFGFRVAGHGVQVAGYGVRVTGKFHVKAGTLAASVQSN